MCSHRAKSAGSASVSLRSLLPRRESGRLVQGSGLGGQTRGSVCHTMGHQAWWMGEEAKETNKFNLKSIFICEEFCLKLAQFHIVFGTCSIYI